MLNVQLGIEVLAQPLLAGHEVRMRLALATLGAGGVGVEALIHK